MGLLAVVSFHLWSLKWQQQLALIAEALVVGVLFSGSLIGKEALLVVLSHFIILNYGTCLFHRPRLLSITLAATAQPIQAVSAQLTLVFSLGLTL